MSEEQGHGRDVIDARVATALVDDLVEIAHFQRGSTGQANLCPNEAAQLVKTSAHAPVGIVQRDEALRIDSALSASLPGLSGFS